MFRSLSFLGISMRQRSRRRAFVMTTNADVQLVLGFLLADAVVLWTEPDIHEDVA